MTLWERFRIWLGLAETEEMLPSVGEVMPRSLPDLATISTNLHKTTVMNSLSINTKMDTLYLIDNGRAIPFDLSNPNGVLVTSIGGQLMIATDIPRQVSIDAPTTDSEGGKLPGVMKFKITKNSQWTAVFNENSSVLAIIGVTDITAKLTAPEPSTTRGVSFQIKSRPVNIHRTDDELSVVFIDRFG